MKKKNKVGTDFPTLQFGYWEDDGTEERFLTTRNELSDVAFDMQHNEVKTIAVYKLEKVVVIKNTSDFQVINELKVQ